MPLSPQWAPLQAGKAKLGRGVAGWAGGSFTVIELREAPAALWCTNQAPATSASAARNSVAFTAKWAIRPSPPVLATCPRRGPLAALAYRNCAAARCRAAGRAEPAWSFLRLFRIIGDF